MDTSIRTFTFNGKHYVLQLWDIGGERSVVLTCVTVLSSYARRSAQPAFTTTSKFCCHFEQLTIVVCCSDVILAVYIDNITHTTAYSSAHNKTYTRDFMYFTNSNLATNKLPSISLITVESQIMDTLGPANFGVILLLQRGCPL